MGDHPPPKRARSRSRSPPPPPLDPEPTAAACSTVPNLDEFPVNTVLGFRSLNPGRSDYALYCGVYKGLDEDGGSPPPPPILCANAAAGTLTNLLTPRPLSTMCSQCYALSGCQVAPRAPSPRPASPRGLGSSASGCSPRTCLRTCRRPTGSEPCRRKPVVAAAAAMEPGPRKPWRWPAPCARWSCPWRASGGTRGRSTRRCASSATTSMPT